MESLAFKKALVILTNEAFIPFGGRGGRRPRDADTGFASVVENGPAVSYSPSAWTPATTTILDPPADLRSMASADEEFLKRHRKTGIDVVEVAYFWMYLRRQLKMDLTFVSPRGGPTAPDPSTIEFAEKDEKLRHELREDKDMWMKLTHTLPISWVNPEDYDLVLVPGSQGAMFDLPQHDDVACAIAKIYEKGGYVAAIGHGVAALLNVKLQHGEYLLKHRKVTCFSNAEEKEKGYEKYLPFMLEDKVRERGAKLEIRKPFEPNVTEDERLLTGQSTPSIHEFVRRIVECAKKGRRD